MTRARISGVGSAAPDVVVSNDALTALMDTSDEWIRTRSGIEERRWVRSTPAGSQPTTNSGLAAEAAQRAFDAAAIGPADVGAIVYATVSADNEFPGSGPLLRKALGIRRPIPVIEVRNHCSGFIYGLEVASTYVRTAAYRHVLVVGSEVQSTGLNVTTAGRDTAVLFGDGAGAAVVSTDRGHEILDAAIESDGEFAPLLGVRAPCFARPVPLCTEDFSGEHPAAYPHMDGKFVFKQASIRMPEIVRKLLNRNGLGIDELDILVPHQANQRILDMVGRELGERVRVVSNIARYGNTTAASIPIALSEAVTSGQIAPGALVCLVSFGAGFSWGAVLIRW